MKPIYFQITNGAQVWINPNHLVTITKAKAGTWVITDSQNTEWMVEEREAKAVLAIMQQESES
jgi:hypothetical protein